MPYISPEARLWQETVHEYPQNEGELNYLITRLCDTYIAARGLKYATINSVVGVLECAKLELYRRIAAPYEDQKKHENGDVYTCQSN